MNCPICNNELKYYPASMRIINGIGYHDKETYQCRNDGWQIEYSFEYSDGRYLAKYFYQNMAISLQMVENLNFAFTKIECRTNYKTILTEDFIIPFNEIIQLQKIKNLLMLT